MAAAEKRLYVRLKNTRGDWTAPAELRERLIADADAQGSNMTDVVTQILARVYKVPVVPNPRKTAPARDADQIQLRLPEPLRLAIRAQAGARDHSVQREIVMTLAAHYGLRMPATVRTRAAARGPAADAALVA